MSVQDSVDNAIDSLADELTAENIDAIKEPEMIAYEKYIEWYGYAAKNPSNLVAFAKRQGIHGVKYSKSKIMMSLMKSEETAPSIRQTQSMSFPRSPFPKSSENNTDEKIGSINSSTNKQQKNENKDDEKMNENDDCGAEYNNNKNKNKQKQKQQKNQVNVESILTEEKKKTNDEDDNSIPNSIKSLR